MTVLVAAEGFAACLERDWIPAERELHVDLRPLGGNEAMVRTIEIVGRSALVEYRQCLPLAEASA